MKRLLMYLSAVLVMILLFAGVGAILLAKYIDPNDFKPLIASQLKKVIKRDVSISGDLNWQFFPELGVKIAKLNIANPTTTAPNGKIVIEEASVNVRLMPLFHRQVDISGISVSGINMPQYNVQHAVFSASNVKMDAAFPIDLTFDYQSGKETIPVKLSAKVFYDAARKQIDTSDLKASIGKDVGIAGKVNVTKLDTQPVLHGNFNISAKDLKPMLIQLGQDPKSIQAADNLRGQIEVMVAGSNTNIDGQITLDTLVANNIRFTGVSARPRLRNNVLSLNPITAKFYEGELKSTVNVDMTAGEPVISANTHVLHFQANGLVRDILGGKGDISINSVGDIHMLIKTSGSNGVVLTRNLNGGGQFSFGPGTLTGVDLKAVITSAYALIKRKPELKSNDTNQSRFDRVSGTMNIHSGIIQSNDVILDSPDFVTNGDGRIDLPSKWINFVFNTKVKKEANSRDDWNNLYGIPIPIAVRGQLADPKVSLDAGQLLKSIAAAQLKGNGEEAKQKLQDKLLENVSPEAGELIKGILQ